MDVAGIDGCHDGWVAVRLSGTGVTTTCEESFADVWNACDGCEHVLVDVPVGLVSATSGGANGYKRRCDTLVRKRIASPSSVFQVPVREAVEAYNKDDKDEEGKREAARQTQQEATGKGLTSQALSLLPKIAEVDTFVQEHDGGGVGGDSDLSTRLLESHPELCFTALNGGDPLAHPKSTRHSDTGLFERYDLLDKAFGRQGWFDEGGENDTAALLWEALDDTEGRDVTFDDVLDAFALALVARGEHATLPVPSDTDADIDEVLGRRIAMTYSPPGVFGDEQ